MTTESHIIESVFVLKKGIRRKSLNISSAFTRIGNKNRGAEIAAAPCLMTWAGSQGSIPRDVEHFCHNHTGKHFYGLNAVLIGLALEFHLDLRDRASLEKFSVSPKGRKRLGVLGKSNVKDAMRLTAFEAVIIRK